MNSMRGTFKGLIVAALAALLLPLAACVQEVGDIDRTQANAIDKGQFAGVWYYVKTVVDIPYSSAFTFQGETNFGNGAKIVFDVQEKWLVAYPVLETVKGSEAQFTKQQIRRYWDPDRRGEFIEVYVGQPVAMWPIQSHFDIKRDYNTATGEQSNVITENTSDRPWYERDYVRVDWNGEAIREAGFITGNAAAEPVHYVQDWENNGLNPDAIEFDSGYLSVVSKYFATPSLYACYAYRSAPGDCAGAMVKVRHSFKHALPNDDVETRVYTNREQMEKFGFFLSERHDYDDYVGVTESGRDYKAQLWNLWEKSQNFEPVVGIDGKERACNTNVDCELGERCMAEKWFENGVCMVGTPIPYRQRGLNPIIYHMSVSHPGIAPPVPQVDDDGQLVGWTGGNVVVSEGKHKDVHPLVREAYETADGWSDVFKETVAWLYYHETIGLLKVEDRTQGARSCSSNADCTAGRTDILHDAKADTTTKVKVLCKGNNDCNAYGGACYSLQGSDCSTLGNCACGKELLCSASAPCPYDMACVAGSCYAATDKACSGDSDCGGDPCVDKMCQSLAVDLTDQVSNPRAYTFVLADDGKGGVTSVRTTDGVFPAELGSEKASVRFVNASPGANVSFRIVESDPAAAATDAALSQRVVFEGVAFDPASTDDVDGYFDPSGKQYPYEVVDPGKWRRVEVLDGSNVVATLTNVSLAAGKTYLFAFIGGDTIVNVASSVSPAASDPTLGVRVINGIKDRDMVDVGLDAARIGKDMTFGQVTSYLKPVKRGINRLLVLEAGVPGDVTCFQDNEIGKCVGWGPRLDEKAEGRVNEIKTSLPEMFVLCEPIYTGDSCTEDQMGKMGQYNDCRYSHMNDDGTISNPCKDKVPHPDMVKKIGDARYNLFYWAGEAQAASPLGYGPTAADPETGRSFWAASNIYGPSLITYGQYAVDLINLVNGKLSVDDTISGKYITDYIAASKDGRTQDDYTSLHEGLTLGSSTSGTATGNTAAGTFAGAKTAGGFGALDPLGAYAGVQQQALTQVRQYAMNPKYKFRVAQNPLAPVSTKSSLEIALDKIKGSYIEGILVNDEVKMAMTNGALLPGDDVTDEFADAVDPSSWIGNKALRQEQKRMALLTRSENCVFMPDFMDGAIYGLARELGCSPEDEADGRQVVSDYLEALALIDANKAATGYERLPDDVCLDGEALHSIITARIYGGVLEHEVGHTMGLRHNFAGSNDIFNYFDEYYDIREKETVRCLDFQGCNFARGEQCHFDCQADSDCARGTFCQNGSCTDPEFGDPMGQCIGPAQVALSKATCKPNLAKAKAGDMVPSWDEATGACLLKGLCAKDADCSEGEICKSDTCEKTTPSAAYQTAYVTSCSSSADCGGGLCGDPEGTGTSTCWGLTKAIVSRGYVTDDEKVKRRYEFQYSTVMDYMQKINGDVNGLGKYDYAAIKYGYGDLVEVYQDTSMIDEYTTLGAPFYGESVQKFSSFARDSYLWGNSLYHPFFFLNNVVTIEGNKAKNRVTVPYQQVKLEADMNYDYDNEYYWNSYIEVPYDFCSDEYRGNGGCMYFDSGADAVETTEHAMEMLTQYYIFDAFQRERFGWGYGNASYSYYARIMDRWMNPLRLSGLYFALYENIFAELTFWEDFSRQPMEAEYMRLSSNMAYQYLHQLIASPAPGRYELDTETNMYVNVSYDTTPTDDPNALVIPIGQGKFPYTTFDAKLGYYSFDHPIYAGAFWEKLAAMETLTDASVSFLSDYVGEQLDIGVSSAIGFVTAYPGELTNLFGGIAVDAWEEWAGVAMMEPKSGRLQYRPRSAFYPEAQSTMPTVEPSINTLSFKTLASFIALATLPAGFDPSITDSMAVVLEGNESDYTLAPGMEWKKFTDPFSFKTYLALVPRYDAERLAVAARLVDTANALKKGWEEATDDVVAAQYANQLHEVVEMLDVLRELNETLGTIRY